MPELNSYQKLSMHERLRSTEDQQEAVELSQRLFGARPGDAELVSQPMAEVIAIGRSATSRVVETPNEQRRAS